MKGCTGTLNARYNLNRYFLECYFALYILNNRLDETIELIP